MDIGMFTILVSACAVLYAFASREIQYRFGNRKEMDAINKDMKVLTEKLKDAQKRSDSAEMEKIMQEQTQMMGKLSGTMLGGFKAIAIVLVLFLALTFALDMINPTKADDVTILLGDSGVNCDAVAQDGIYTGCYEIPSAGVHGEWDARIIAREGSSDLAENSTKFLVGEGTLSSYHHAPKNRPLPIELDKEAVKPGEVITLRAHFEKFKDVRATFDSGTRFFVDLPVTIPFLNVSRINDVYWWFILISLLAQLILIPLVYRVIKMVK